MLRSETFQSRTIFECSDDTYDTAADQLPTETLLCFVIIRHCRVKMPCILWLTSHVEAQRDAIWVNCFTHLEPVCAKFSSAQTLRRALRQIGDLRQGTGYLLESHYTRCTSSRAGTVEPAPIDAVP